MSIGKRLSPERIAEIRAAAHPETVFAELLGHIEAIEAELSEQISITDAGRITRDKLRTELSEARAEIARLTQLLTATQLQSASRGKALLKK